jgi:excisionase family DNA binding protein
MKLYEQHGSVPLSLTVQEAAYELRCSTRHVYNLIERGAIKSFTLGRSRRITTSSIQKLTAPEAV